MEYLCLLDDVGKACKRMVPVLRFFSVFSLDVTRVLKDGMFEGKEGGLLRGKRRSSRKSNLQKARSLFLPKATNLVSRRILNLSFVLSLEEKLALKMKVQWKNRCMALNDYVLQYSFGD